MRKAANTFVSIIVGILLIIGGILLIFWNEKNNVKNISAVKELRNEVINIENDKIDNKNNNKLVHVSGKLTISGKLTDNNFKVSVLTGKLSRIVEMYQWDESCSTDSNNKKSCTYDKKWSDSLLDSSKYKESGYNNPTTMPYKSLNIIAKNAKLGVFNVSEDQLKQLSTNKSYTEFSYIPSGYKKNGNYITNSTDVNNPKIGDIRISFVYSDSENISIIAMQKDNTLVDYTTDKGVNINYITEGIKSAEEMISNIEKGNNTLKWILRAIGLFIEILGFGFILSPILAITNYIPIVNGAMSFVVILLGTMVTLVFTAIAWLSARPIMSIGLLAISGILIFVIVKKLKKNKGV